MINLKESGHEVLEMEPKVEVAQPEIKTQVVETVNDLCSICDHKLYCALRATNGFTFQCDDYE